MKLVVLTGSPRSNGSGAALVERFIAGASDAGAEIIRFDTAKLDVHPCVGCDNCRRNGGTCVYDDDFTAIRTALFEADAVAFVSPVYYFGISGQLKCVLDRWHAIGGELRKLPKRAALLLTLANPNPVAADAARTHIERVFNWLHWDLHEPLIAAGIHDPADYDGTDYLARAYELGVVVASKAHSRV